MSFIQLIFFENLFKILRLLSKNSVLKPTRKYFKVFRKRPLAFTSKISNPNKTNTQMRKLNHLYVSKLK